MMFNFPEIVPRNLYECGPRDHEGELCVIIFLDIRVWEGDTAPPRIRTFRKYGC